MSTYLLDTNVVVRLMEPAAPEHTIVRNAVHRLIEAGHTLVLAPQEVSHSVVVGTAPGGGRHGTW